MPPASSFKKPAYHIWFLGPSGSGKTTAAISFPRICSIEFDPTGMDVIYDPSSRASQFAKNLVWRIPMAGVDPKSMFTVTDKPSETSLYGAVALAVDLHAKGQIDTLLLDGYTYMANAKWNHIFKDEDEQIWTKGRSLDTQKMYGRLGQWLSEFTLGTLGALAAREQMNVIITCHIQREGKSTIEGTEVPGDAARSMKRLVDLESDMAPQIVGGFRQLFDGIPSAKIYLDHWQDKRPKVVNKAQVKDAEGHPVMEEFEYHIAYCRKQPVARWDTVIKAGNRLGLPYAMNITDKSFYAVLLGKLKETQDRADEEKAKADAAKAGTTTTPTTATTGATPPAVVEPVASAKATTIKVTKDDKDKGDKEKQS